MVEALIAKSLEDSWAMSDHSRILLSGKSFVADVSGALFWPAEQTLIVADLHFDKGAPLANNGVLLPPYDTRATLSRLNDLIEHYQPQRLIALGDSFRSCEAASNFDQEDLERLEELQSGLDWVWVTGSHDPEIPERLGGCVKQRMNIAGLIFRHEPVQAPVSHEIAGHLHPIAKISQEGRTFRRRCFLSTRSRLILPAFGENADGLNVLDDAFLPLTAGESVFIWILGWNDVYPTAARQLLPD